MEDSVEKIKNTEISPSLMDEIRKMDKDVSTYANTLNSKDLNASTSPSPVLVYGTGEIELVKLSPDVIEKYLWMHPVVPRGIDIKSNRMVERGYTVKPFIKKNAVKPSERAKLAAEQCEKVLANSGGTIRLKKWIDDTYGFGNGYLTAVYNKNKTKILRYNQEHPIFFTIAKFSYPDKKDGQFKIDMNTKEPLYYTQLMYDISKHEYIPTGIELKNNKVAHLKFDTWGDEQLGISLIQYCHRNIKYLLNIEEAGAETMYRNGFVQKKVQTEITNEKELGQMGLRLNGLNSADAIILPKGTTMDNLLPGTTDFKSYHDIFLTLVSIRLGIPKPLLTLDGTSTNKSTVDEQRKDMRADFSSDETVVKQVIEDNMFVPICRASFGEGFEEIPLFEFNEYKEDLDLRAERNENLSKAMSNVVDSIEVLRNLGKFEEVERLSLYLISLLPEEIQEAKIDEKKIKKQEKEAEERKKAMEQKFNNPLEKEDETEDKKEEDKKSEEPKKEKINEE